MMQNSWYDELSFFFPFAVTDYLNFTNGQVPELTSNARGEVIL